MFHYSKANSTHTHTHMYIHIYTQVKNTEGTAKEGVEYGH